MNHGEATRIKTRDLVKPDPTNHQRAGNEESLWRVVVMVHAANKGVSSPLPRASPANEAGLVHSHPFNSLADLPLHLPLRLLATKEEELGVEALGQQLRFFYNFY